MKRNPRNNHFQTVRGRFSSPERRALDTTKAACDGESYASCTWSTQGSCLAKCPLWTLVDNPDTQPLNVTYLTHKLTLRDKGHTAARFTPPGTGNWTSQRPG